MGDFNRTHDGMKKMTDLSGVSELLRMSKVRIIGNTIENKKYRQIDHIYHTTHLRNGRI